MFHSVLKHTLTIKSFCGIILTQELVLLSMVVSVIKLYHRRTFSCFLFVIYILYLSSRSFSPAHRRMPTAVGIRKASAVSPLLPVSFFTVSSVVLQGQ